MQSHVCTCGRLDHFHQVLTNLFYEGRVWFGKNLKAVREILVFFQDEIVTHLAVEESVIFPYLKRHIPRLEPVIEQIHVEHQDFRKSLKSFKSLLSRVSEAKDFRSRGELIRKIKWTGTHIICHLKFHLLMENATVYKAIESELSRYEQRDLVKKINHGLKSIIRSE